MRVAMRSGGAIGSQCEYMILKLPSNRLCQELLGLSGDFVVKKTL